MNYLSRGYFGSNSMKTSTENVEIIQQHKPKNWIGSFQAYKFTILNKAPCTIKINNGDPIYLEPWQGFTMSESDMPISKFEILEKDVPYNYIGAY